MSELVRAPQRPRTRPEDVAGGLFPPGHRVDRSNPTHPAGSDPSNLTALMQMDAAKRQRHGDLAGPHSTGAARWHLR